MAGPCPTVYAQLAHQVGDFSCRTANPFINLRDPFHLTSWTQPVVEAVMIGGAILALWDAARRRRRAGDPTGLALWLAAVLYVLILEPPLYFPQESGLQNQVGLIFVHNVFTVQFLYDRLPLYIVAVYPAMAYLAYRLVESLGVFEHNGSVTRAVKAGPTENGKNGYLFLHAALYLGAFALLWGTALPAYADAHRGITRQGTPIGSLPTRRAARSYAPL